MESNPADPKSAISYGYSKLVLSQISKNTSEAMMSLYKQGLSEYQARPELLEKFFGFKNQKVTPELAAMSLVANAFLNLDEFLTKP